MSSVSLPFAERPHPQPARIAALSAAIALNLTVILIAARPVSPAYFTTIRQLAPVALVHFITPPAQPAPPPPVELKPLPPTLTVPQQRPRPTPISAPMPAPVTEGRIAAPPSDAATVLPADPAATALATAPVEASLAYRANPVEYPLAALRQQLQGTVVLRVLVDETGKPLEVSVLRGSGHSLLDRSAREQVLAHWRFRPAIVEGHAVRAWASVPVTFALRG